MNTKQTIYKSKDIIVSKINVNDTLYYLDLYNNILTPDFIHVGFYNKTETDITLKFLNKST